MKKLIFLFAMVVASFSITHAQQATLMPLIAGDTLNNTDTLYKNISATAGYSALGVQVNVTKISGTIAGNVVLIGSLDGTNYVATGDTMVLANVALNTYVFTRSTTPYTTYRVKFLTTGTQSYVPRVYYVLRKYNQ